jgi:hypothetical protein
MFCGSLALIQRSVVAVHVKPAPCRRWSCEMCAPKRRALVEMQIEAGQPDAHIVLTLRRVAGASPEAARQRLGKAIPEFFRRYERLTGVHVERFAVIEAHKSGWPHAHLACRNWKFGNIKAIWALWRQVTGDSDHVRVRRVPAKRMKKYLAKYLGKDLRKFGDSKRYWRTPRYLPADFGKPSEEDCERWRGWACVHEHPEAVIAGYLRAGWYRHDAGDGVTALTPPLWATASPRGPP